MVKQRTHVLTQGQQRWQNPQRKQYKKKYNAKNREKINTQRRLRRRPRQKLLYDKKRLIRIKAEVVRWQQKIGPAEVLRWKQRIGPPKVIRRAKKNTVIKQKQQTFTHATPPVKMKRSSRKMIEYSVKDLVSLEITGNESNKIWCEGQVVQVERNYSNFLRYIVEYRTAKNKTMQKLINVKPDRVRPSQRKVSPRRRSYLMPDDLVLQQRPPEVLGPSIPNQLTLRENFLSGDEWNDTNEYMKDVVENMLSHNPGNISQLK